MFQECTEQVPAINGHSVWDQARMKSEMLFTPRFLLSLAFDDSVDVRSLILPVLLYSLAMWFGSY